ncbi:MAG TPA: DUF3341 domain-containing protein [Candidatus Margulisiibacteriota bacterium]|nr:DUF3341 domain-containing protein [Candidatus Margulisiibacteriota bacterium]
MESVCVTGCFPEAQACARAVATLHKAGCNPLWVFSPFASQEVLEALEVTRSPVRLWVLLGGLFGCAAGFALTIGLSAEYPHVTAGMPIVSIPPFVIIAFELTILCGALSGLLGFLLQARIPRFEAVPGYSLRFSNDRFGVVIHCAAHERARTEAAMYQAGALEVTCEPA